MTLCYKTSLCYKISLHKTCKRYFYSPGSLFDQALGCSTRTADQVKVCTNRYSWGSSSRFFFSAISGQINAGTNFLVSSGTDQKSLIYTEYDITWPSVHPYRFKPDDDVHIHTYIWKTFCLRHLLHVKLKQCSGLFFVKLFSLSILTLILVKTPEALNWSWHLKKNGLQGFFSALNIQYSKLVHIIISIT